MFEVAARFGIELAAVAHLLRSHRGVRGELGGLETGDLDPAGRGDAFADHGGGLACDLVGGEFLEIHERHLDMDVDPVEQRPADLLAVVFDLPDGAATLLI